MSQYSTRSLQPPSIPHYLVYIYIVTLLFLDRLSLTLSMAWIVYVFFHEICPSGAYLGISLPHLGLLVVFA